MCHLFRHSLMIDLVLVANAQMTGRTAPQHFEPMEKVRAGHVDIPGVVAVALRLAPLRLQAV